jgi:hypothetical protein
MYSGHKYLSQPVVGYRSNYNELSGGFPHSDIHGSKPIPGSPWLNAGYHVLHRLLLPRHPPNALFALDLTRKEQGRRSLDSRLPGRSSTYPCRIALVRNDTAVSVLDLEQYHPSGSNPRPLHTRNDQMILMFLSLNDVKSRPSQDDRTHPRMRSMIL